STGERCCRHSGCVRRPCFAWEGEKKGAFCASHRPEGMVNVLSPRCL
ncbi:unnamed protein product, partial [Discosporangium mesarthrocarpum]